MVPRWPESPRGAPALGQQRPRGGHVPWGVGDRSCGRVPAEPSRAEGSTLRVELSSPLPLPAALARVPALTAHAASLGAPDGWAPVLRPCPGLCCVPQTVVLPRVGLLCAAWSRAVVTKTGRARVRTHAQLPERHGKASRPLLGAGLSLPSRGPVREAPSLPVLCWPSPPGRGHGACCAECLHSPRGHARASQHRQGGVCRDGEHS